MIKHLIHRVWPADHRTNARWPRPPPMIYNERTGVGRSVGLGPTGTGRTGNDQAPLTSYLSADNSMQTLTVSIHIQSACCSDLSLAKTRIPRRRQRHPRQDVGVVECQLNATQTVQRFFAARVSAPCHRSVTAAVLFKRRSALLCSASCPSPTTDPFRPRRTSRPNNAPHLVFYRSL